MSKQFAPLPDEFTSSPFSVSDARAQGITRDVIDHPRFSRPYRGVRSLTTGTDEPGVYSAEHARAAAATLTPRLRPGELFSHSTALALLGCPIRTDPRPHVAIPLPSAPTAARGVHGHNISSLRRPWVNRAGLAIVPPTQAFIQAAGVLPFRELVVAADHLVKPRGRYAASAPIVELEELRVLVASSRARGSRRARAALHFTRVGAESRMETILRLLMARYGLDVLELQVNVADAQGRWIGRFDMVDLARKLIIEYDGDQHRTSTAQYEHDQARLERAREAGFRVLRFRKTHVIDEPLLTAKRIAEALDRPLIPVRGQIARFFAE